jgi:hypothetical protein
MSTVLTMYRNQSKQIEVKVNVLWNQQVPNNRTIFNYKLDIVIHDNENGTCMLLDVALSGDRYVINKESEKILKYKGLIIEIQCTWNVKSRVIPVITGANGSISESFRQYLSNILGKQEIKELQKTPYWALHIYCIKY